MSSRTKITLDFLSYEGSVSNDPVDSIRYKKSVEESTATEVFRKLEAIADGVSDQTITLPDATSEYVIISTDQTISIKLNGSTDAMTLSPKSAGVKAPVFFMKGTITGLTLSNASGSTANIDVIAINV